MNRNAKEIRDALDAVKQQHPDTADVIDDAKKIITHMSADLRRQGASDYAEETTDE